MRTGRAATMHTGRPCMMAVARGFAMKRLKNRALDTCTIALNGHTQVLTFSRIGLMCVCTHDYAVASATATAPGPGGGASARTICPAEICNCIQHNVAVMRRRVCVTVCAWRARFAWRKRSCFGRKLCCSSQCSARIERNAGGIVKTSPYFCGANICPHILWKFVRYILVFVQWTINYTNLFDTQVYWMPIAVSIEQLGARPHWTCQS